MFKKLIQSGYLTLVLCGVYAAVMAPVAPGFATTENLVNVLVAMLPLFVVACGQTVVMIAAGIDLSVTSIIAVTGIAGASLVTGEGGWLADHALGVPIALIIMLLLGSAIGFFNGACVAWLKMPPFIVTLTTMMFVSGVAIWYTKSESIYDLPDGMLLPGGNVWIATGVAVAVAATVHLMLQRTLLGMGLNAIGNNPQAAEMSGIDVDRVTILAYVVSGLCAAIGSVLITGELETASPVQWENNLLDVIGATVIGGTSLYGGRGSILWTLAGVLLLTLIDNSLNLLSLSYFTIMIAKGGIIVLAALLDTLRHRMGAQ